MNLEIKNVSKTLPEYRQVIDLVKNSFPKEEQYLCGKIRPDAGEAAKTLGLEEKCTFLGLLSK